MMLGGLAVLMGVTVGWWLSARLRVEPLRAELKQIELVAEAEGRRYRQLEQEVSRAQQAHVEVWRRERARADGYWLRLRQAGGGDVPGVPPQPGGAGAGDGGGVEAAGGADRGALPVLGRDLVDALEVGEKLEATLQLCQAELRACAGLR